MKESYLFEGTDDTGHETSYLVQVGDGEGDTPDVFVGLKEWRGPRAGKTMALMLSPAKAKELAEALSEAAEVAIANEVAETLGL